MSRLLTIALAVLMVSAETTSMVTSPVNAATNLLLPDATPVQIPSVSPPKASGAFIPPTPVLSPIPTITAVPTPSEALPLPPLPTLPLPTPAVVVPTLPPITGIASWYGPGEGVATQWCTWVLRHSTGCGWLVVQSHQTGIVVIAPVIDWCQCYRGTTDERIVDLQWGVVDALGLERSQGLYEVSTWLSEIPPPN